MAKQTLFPLFAAEDAGKVQPILDALKAKGFSIGSAEKTPKKGDTVLFFLSEKLTESSDVIDAFLRHDAGKREIIPINLDGSTPPALIENALMARNTIFAERYSAEELASRIADALKKPVPIAVTKLRKWLIAAAAVIVLAVVGIVVWKLLPKKASDAVAQETPAPTAAVLPDVEGIPGEDLEKVHELIIMGDTLHYFTGTERWVSQQGLARVGAEHFANRTEEEGKRHWYSNEDGHEIEMAEWSDLSFLRYMKNVKMITLVRVKGELPDLSGLENLGNVELLDCDITSIDGLKNTKIGNFGYSGNALKDFSPLSDCPRLRSVNLMLFDPIPQDLTSFGPPSMTDLWIDTDSSARTVDLSGLKNCPDLVNVTLDSLPLSDLDCLSDCRKLRELELVTMSELQSLNGLQDHQYLYRLRIDYESENLRDCSALSDNTSLHYVDLHNEALNDLSWLSNAKDLEEIELWFTRGVRSLHGLEDHTKLRRVHIEGLEHLTDISALESCTGIEQIELSEVFDLSNISPIVQLPKLKWLTIYGSVLNDVNFLSDIVNKNGFSFGIAEVQDWSGLEAIKNYDFLNITDRNGSALSYIKDAKIKRFELWCRSGYTNWSQEPLDWSLFPTVTEELFLHGVVSLEGMPALPITGLFIDDSQTLTSLDGVENLEHAGDGMIWMNVKGCPRLVDWSALDGMKLAEIRCEHTFTLPNFAAIDTSSIELMEPVDLFDLHCFDGMDPDRRVSIELFQTMDVTDLQPLYGIKNGNTLRVPAHLQEQAQLLVESGNFRAFEVVYPDEWWEPARFDVTLLSLDELDTLPSAVLKRVNKLNMVGDVIFSWDDYWVDQQWDDGQATFTLRANDGDASHDIVIEHPGTLTDFSKLSALTGLEELSLQDQSFDSLDGAQNLENLWKLEVSFTPTLTDASAAFTLQNLEELRLQYTGVTSVQGVQNLTKLRLADFNGLTLDDLTPLAAIPENCDLMFDFPLMTVDEFLALPDSVLDVIEEIAISGNYVHSPWGNWWFEIDWGTRRTYIHGSSTGERIPCEVGPITDLSDLPVMQNLRNLQINRQPIENLDGLEKQPALRQFRMQWCPGVTDISLLFTMPQIEDISVRDSNIKSLEGIGALPHLLRADFGGGGVPIHTLSWLSEIDFTYAETPDENGNVPHFDLSIDWWDLKDEEYQYLALVPEFSWLNLNGHAVSKWMDVLKGKKIDGISVQECNFDDETFKAFIEQHPELTEIDMRNNPRLTDISILLTLPNLWEISVSDNMRQAIESLGDHNGFRLEIE